VAYRASPRERDRMADGAQKLLEVVRGLMAQCRIHALSGRNRGGPHDTENEGLRILLRAIRQPWDCSSNRRQHMSR